MCVAQRVTGGGGSPLARVRSLSWSPPVPERAVWTAAIGGPPPGGSADSVARPAERGTGLSTHRGRQLHVTSAIHRYNSDRGTQEVSVSGSVRKCHQMTGTRRGSNTNASSDDAPSPRSANLHGTLDIE